jgi:hypothetical protein
MSKRLLSFFLGELEIIRIHCGSSTCGGVIEFPTKQLASLKRTDQVCPACGAQFRLSNSTLIQLGLDIEALQKANMEIEFVLPDNSEPTK